MEQVPNKATLDHSVAFYNVQVSMVSLFFLSSKGTGGKHIYIYIIKELPQQAAVEGTISLAVLEKRKDWKTQEVGVKRKW